MESLESDGAELWRLEARVLCFLVRRYGGGALEVPVFCEMPSWMSLLIVEEFFDERPTEERDLERKISDEQRLESSVESALLPFKRRATLRHIERANEGVQATPPPQSLLESLLECCAQNIEAIIYGDVVKHQKQAQKRESQRAFRQCQRERVAAQRALRRRG